MSRSNSLALIRSPVYEVLKPILYADIFDFPLTFEEVYQFLESEATLEEVERSLNQALKNRQLLLIDGFYCLPQRSHLAARRRERWTAAQSLWPQARQYGRWIAALPFVRLVAVTGSLAVDNPRPGSDDIDYLIVTHPNRLWLCRAMIILLVKFGRARGVHLCPNYLITENVLHFEEHNLFTAREMVQIVPLYGKDFHLRLWQFNRWVTDFLPQTNGLNFDRLDDELPFFQRFFKQSGELVWRGWLGDSLERLLQKIQIGKHTRQAQACNAVDKVVFTPDICKGHYDSHGHKTINAYRQQLENYGLNGQQLANGKVKL